MDALEYGPNAPATSAPPIILGPNPSGTMFSSMTYTDIRDPPIEGPSSMKMTSPSVLHGLITGQSPATPDPTIGSGKPSYSIMLDSNGDTLYLCECGYATRRMSDMRRHHEYVGHEGRRYTCTFLGCNRWFVRKCKLEEHLKKHSINP